MLGLVINEKAKAYPFSVLSRQPVLNDNFQGIPLLIVFDSESATGVIFKRRLEGRDLLFKRTTGSDKTGLFLADDATKSIWDGLSGTGVQGPLKSKKLAPLPMTPSFWFGWVDHYPNTELFALSK